MSNIMTTIMRATDNDNADITLWCYWISTRMTIMKAYDVISGMTGVWPCDVFLQRKLCISLHDHLFVLEDRRDSRLTCCFLMATHFLVKIDHDEKMYKYRKLLVVSDCYFKMFYRGRLELLVKYYSFSIILPSIHPKHILSSAILKTML